MPGDICSGGRSGVAPARPVVGLVVLLDHCGVDEGGDGKHPDADGGQSPGVKLEGVLHVLPIRAPAEILPGHLSGCVDGKDAGSPLQHHCSATIDSLA